MIRPELQQGVLKTTPPEAVGHIGVSLRHVEVWSGLVGSGRWRCLIGGSQALPLASAGYASWKVMGASLAAVRRKEHWA